MRIFVGLDHFSVVLLSKSGKDTGKDNRFARELFRKIPSWESQYFPGDIKRLRKD
jgi:hypothetical protein